MKIELMKYKAYLLSNFKTIPQLEKMDTKDIEAIEVVGNVLPFKVNNYVIDELIDWDNYKKDPIFRLTFPQKEMLADADYNLMKQTLQDTQDKAKIKETANKIRYKLNPHPA
ncbi:MAG TPA: hypothetical protein VKY44_02915, partial [Flavobacterium sp.]|nr:hypothetical protein [Flavobacterium sp.]